MKLDLPATYEFLRKKNLSAKEEFTQVNPCREYKRKPLGQGRIHPSESLSRVRKKSLSAKKVERKPLGQGRIHPSESLSRVRKENISAKEEFTQVNPCREYGRNLSASRPREFERKPLGQGRIHPSESLPVRKKTSRPRKNSPK